MHRFRRHSDPFAHMRGDFPFQQDPTVQFANRARHPFRHQGYGGGRMDGFFGYSDEEPFDDESSASSYDGMGGYGYERDEWRRGMRKGRVGGFDEINAWNRHHPNYAGADLNDSYDSDYYDEGHAYPPPRYHAQRHRRETSRRPPPNKHSHQHHQQHRSSHHQHHHVHHHQYIHNCAQPTSSIMGPRHNYDDGYEQNTYGPLPYGNNANGGLVGVGSGALLPYNHHQQQPSRRYGLLRSPRYGGYGGDYGCGILGGGGIPRSGMALGQPLPGIPVPRRY